MLLIYYKKTYKNALNAENFISTDFFKRWTSFFLLNYCKNGFSIVCSNFRLNIFSYNNCCSFKCKAILKFLEFFKWKMFFEKLKFAYFLIINVRFEKSLHRKPHSQTRLQKRELETKDDLFEFWTKSYTNSERAESFLYSKKVESFFNEYFQGLKVNFFFSICAHSFLFSNCLFHP